MYRLACSACGIAWVDYHEGLRSDCNAGGTGGSDMIGVCNIEAFSEGSLHRLSNRETTGTRIGCSATGCRDCAIEWFTGRLTRATINSYSDWLRSNSNACRTGCGNTVSIDHRESL